MRKPTYEMSNEQNWQEEFDDDDNDIKYLHQLQNLIFALCGEELPHTTTLLSQL